jgi:hypothetical protein
MIFMIIGSFPFVFSTASLAPGKKPGIVLEFLE